VLPAVVLVGFVVGVGVFFALWAMNVDLLVALGGAIIAAIVFSVGFVQNLATMRVLVVRSLLTAAGSILAVVVARKAIRTLTSTQQSVDAPLNDLNLGEFIDEGEGSSTGDTSGQMESAEATEESADAEGGDLQEAPEDEVEQGNDEGVEEIADLISDSIDEG